MQRASLALALGLVCAVTARPTPAWARSEKLLGYSPQAVWNPAVRFVRVDENLTITDRDAEAGYILFELREEKKVFRGSLEVIPASPDHGARVILDIRDRPSYMEVAMLERLERKLLAELGPAPSPPKKPDAREGKKDGGKDGGKDGKKDAPGRPSELPEAPTQPIPEA